MNMIQIVISIVLSVAVLAGISMMSKVKTAVMGNLLSAIAMLAGVVGTLYFNGILTVWSIYSSLLVGCLIGGLVAARAKMIQMPQLVALFNGLGGAASALVGLMTYMHWGEIVETAYPVFTTLTAVLAIVIGMVTFVGSLIAAGKLSRLLNQKPTVYPLHNMWVVLVLLTIAVCTIAGSISDSKLWMALLIIALSVVFGWLFAIRVGGADMPITISLLNSLSGVAGAIAGMAIGDIFLVSVGGIVGASGLLLTQVMCRAMNRSLWNIILPKQEKKSSDIPMKDIKNISEINTIEELLENLDDMEIQQLLDAINNLTAEVRSLREALNIKPQQETAKEEKTPAGVLKSAKDVIIVPGYGMALAQAQHTVKALADRLEQNGARVRFAIHPVAGRMPGHMNVLLAEVDIPYEQLFEMDAINDDFKKADAVVVIGANDVLNPAARNAKGTPIYGMPVLNVDQAKEVIVCNYDLKPGYAGVENPLYKRTEGVYLCLGDAKQTLTEIIGAL